METLVDPFELGSKAALRPDDGAPAPKPNGAAIAGRTLRTDDQLPNPRYSDSWARVRCWCSED